MSAGVEDTEYTEKTAQSAVTVGVRDELLVYTVEITGVSKI